MRSVILASALLIMSFSAVDQPAEPLPAPHATMAGILAISVHVDSLAPAIAESGITASVLGAHVVERLKEAGIEVLNLDATQPVAGEPTLYVEVLAIKREGIDQVVYATRLDFLQPVQLERNPEVKVVASTWSIAGVAVALSDWRDTMIADVVAYTDEFIAAFAAANPYGGD